MDAMTAGELLTVGKEIQQTDIDLLKASNTLIETETLPVRFLNGLSAWRVVFADLLSPRNAKHRPLPQHWPSCKKIQRTWRKSESICPPLTIT